MFAHYFIERKHCSYKDHVTKNRGVLVFAIEL